MLSIRNQSGSQATNGIDTGMLAPQGNAGLGGMYGAGAYLAVPGAAIDPSAAGARPGESTGTPMLVVLWRRKGMVSAVVAFCLVAAIIYLYFATPIFSSTSRVWIDNDHTSVYADPKNPVLKADEFLNTQAEVFESVPVLSRALDSVDYRRMKTFEGVTGNAIEWLKRGGALKVEAGRKSDVIQISMESPQPDEAATLVNSVVESFLQTRGEQKRESGRRMVDLLDKERADVETRRRDTLRAMLDLQQSSGIVSFHEGDRNNTNAARAEALTRSLTEAELMTLESRSQLASAQAVLDHPEAISAFVQGQQFKNQTIVDREYDELRNRMVAISVELTAYSKTNGPNHPRVQLLQSTLGSIREQIGLKEVSMVRALTAQLKAQVVASEEKERSLRPRVEAQRSASLNLTPDAQKFARLESDSERLARQYETLSNRIEEVSVNSREDAGTLGVQVLETATAGERPVKPKKALVLAFALLCGCLIGAGAALVSESRDTRLHSPEEVTSFLGMPVLGMVPRMSRRRVAPGHRPRLRRDVLAQVSEAFRGIRTTIHYGPARDAKTIVLASPMSGDGKSTAASHLAIAMAQAEERVLLIDADLRAPVQHRVFGIDGSVGLSNVLAGQEKLIKAIHATHVNGLFLMPCGMSAGNPADLLTGKRFEEFVEAVKATFDRVIIDSPPLLGATESRILAATSDVTILVLRMNRSHRKPGAIAIEELRRVGARVLGAIANDVPPNKNYPYVGPHGMAAGYDARYPLLSAAPAAATTSDEKDPSDIATENASGRPFGPIGEPPSVLSAKNLAIPGPG